MLKTYSLVIESSNNIVSPLLALEHNLRDHNRTRLEDPTALHQPADGRHRALDIRRRRARGKVLRQHDKRPRQAPDRQPLAPGALAVRLLCRCRGCTLRGAGRRQLCPYEGLRDLGRAPLVAAHAGGGAGGRAGVGVADAGGEGGGSAAAAGGGRGGVAVVEVVGPLAVDVWGVCGLEALGRGAAGAGRGDALAAGSGQCSSCVLKGGREEERGMAWRTFFTPTRLARGPPRAGFGFW